MSMIEEQLAKIGPPPMRFYRDAEGNRMGWHVPARAAPEWVESEPPPKAPEPVDVTAQRLLDETDKEINKHVEGVHVLSPAWMAWRNDLRDAAAGRRDDIPPEPERYAAAEPQAPVALDALLQSGTMLVEDELTIRRGIAMAKVASHAQVLLDARKDPNREALRRDAVARQNNRRAMWANGYSKVDIPPDAEDEALEEEERNHAQWVDAVNRFQADLNKAVHMSGLDMLRDFDVEGAGWPGLG